MWEVRATSQQLRQLRTLILTTLSCPPQHGAWRTSKSVRWSLRFYLISDLVTDIPTSDDGDQDDDVKLPQAMAASVFVSRALPA